MVMKSRNPLTTKITKEIHKGHKGLYYLVGTQNSASLLCAFFVFFVVKKEGESKKIPGQKLLTRDIFSILRFDLIYFSRFPSR